MPRVSVVCIVYNSMTYLPATVASVLAQTFTDFELVIVDDGSSDNVIEWVSALTDARIRLVSQANKGIPGARNTGIEHARGEFIAFLDGDDLWEPMKLEKQVACLALRPEVGFVHTAIRYIDANGHEVNQVLSVRGDGDVWRDLAVQNPVRCGSTPLVRRKCFEDVGVFDPTLFFCDDWDMWIRISKRHHFAAINEPLTLYRQHGANMTKSYQAIMPNLQRVIERTFEDVPADCTSLKKEAYGRAYLFAAWRALFADDLQMTRSLRNEAFSTYPRLRFEKNSISLTLNLEKAQWLGHKTERRP